ncbi:response regulator [Ideonella sp.]|uniref:response regulator n=1 Tax=Ideonella sp. TaxID=1929293 RepID=UPI0035B37901
MIVNDNIEWAHSLADLVEALGHLCWLASDGYSAIQRTDELKPDVVLLALDLPMMCGFEVCQRLRMKHLGRPMKIIAMATCGDDAEREEAISCGFDALLVQPIVLRTLAEALRPAGASAPALHAVGEPGLSATARLREAERPAGH